MFFNTGDELRQDANTPWPSAWRVRRLLHSGAHYRIYEVANAMGEMEDQRAVVKLLRYDPRRVADAHYVDALRQRLRRECETLAHFSPRLPEPLDYFTVYNDQDAFGGFGEEQLRRSEPALVQTFMHGQSIQELMVRHGAPPAAAEKLLLALARVCAFLDELHAGGNGWLFFALTPEHVILDPDLDFEPTFVGTSNLRALRRGLAPHDPLAASVDLPEPGYAAPEALCNGLADRRTDIYAVGAMLFHIFTGVDPRDLVADVSDLSLDEDAASSSPLLPLTQHEAFDLAERLHRSMERFCRRNLKGLGIHRAKVRKIILKCTSPDPADRFDSPLELRDAIVTSLRRSMKMAWPAAVEVGGEE